MSPILATGFPHDGPTQHVPPFAQLLAICSPDRFSLGSKPSLPRESKKLHTNRMRMSLAPPEKRAIKAEAFWAPPARLTSASHGQLPFKAVPKDRYVYKKLRGKHKGKERQKRNYDEKKNGKTSGKSVCGEFTGGFRNIPHLSLKYSTVTKFLSFAIPFAKSGISEK